MERRPRRQPTQPKKTQIDNEPVEKKKNKRSNNDVDTVSPLIAMVFQIEIIHMLTSALQIGIGQIKWIQSDVCPLKHNYKSTVTQKLYKSHLENQHNYVTDSENAVRIHKGDVTEIVEMFKKVKFINKFIDDCSTNTNKYNNGTMTSFSTFVLNSIVESAL